MRLEGSKRRSSFVEYDLGYVQRDDRMIMACWQVGFMDYIYG